MSQVGNRFSSVLARVLQNSSSPSQPSANSNPMPNLSPLQVHITPTPSPLGASSISPSLNATSQQTGTTSEQIQNASIDSTTRLVSPKAKPNRPKGEPATKKAISKRGRNSKSPSLIGNSSSMDSALLKAHLKNPQLGNSLPSAALQGARVAVSGGSQQARNVQPTQKTKLMVCMIFQLDILKVLLLRK